MRSSQATFRFEVPARPRGRAALRLALRRTRVLRAPEHLLLAAMLVLGWAALIAWTGNGPAGWQARLCADDGVSPAACRLVVPDSKIL